ncbi:hypothetical protein HDV00_004281 [Rhizophlyctis rosea]|nr:hypothetical protein HDV00_004281 [Rhizophlyctis rosea]
MDVPLTLSLPEFCSWTQQGNGGGGVEGGGQQPMEGVEEQPGYDPFPSFDSQVTEETVGGSRSPIRTPPLAPRASSSSQIATTTRTRSSTPPLTKNVTHRSPGRKIGGRDRSRLSLTPVLDGGERGVERRGGEFFAAFWEGDGESGGAGAGAALGGKSVEDAVGVPKVDLCYEQSQEEEDGVVVEDEEAAGDIAGNGDGVGGEEVEVRVGSGSGKKGAAEVVPEVVQGLRRMGKRSHNEEPTPLLPLHHSKRANIHINNDPSPTTQKTSPRPSTTLHASSPSSRAKKPPALSSSPSRRAAKSSSSSSSSTTSGILSSSGVRVGPVEERYAKARKGMGLGPLRLVTVGRTAPAPTTDFGDVPDTQPTREVWTGLGEDDEDVRRLIEGVRGDHRVRDGGVGWSAAGGLVGREDIEGEGMDVDGEGEVGDVRDEGAVGSEGDCGTAEDEDGQGKEMGAVEMGSSVTVAGVSLEGEVQSPVVVEGGGTGGVGTTSAQNVNEDTAMTTLPEGNINVVMTESNPATKQPPRLSPNKHATSASHPPTVSETRMDISESESDSDLPPPSPDVVQDSMDEEERDVLEDEELDPHSRSQSPVHESPLKRKRPTPVISTHHHQNSARTSPPTNNPDTSPLAKKRRRNEGPTTTAVRSPRGGGGSSARTYKTFRRRMGGGGGALELSSEVSPGRGRGGGGIVEPSSPLRNGEDVVVQPSPPGRTKMVVDGDDDIICLDDDDDNGANAPAVVRSAEATQTFTQMRAPVVRKACVGCGTTVTTGWRRGPSGGKELCVGCGRVWRLTGVLKRVGGGAGGVGGLEDVGEEEGESGRGGEGDGERVSTTTTHTSSAPGPTSSAAAPTSSAAAPQRGTSSSPAGPSNPPPPDFEFHSPDETSTSTHGGVARRSGRYAGRGKPSPKYRNESSSSEEDDVEKDGEYVEGRGRGRGGGVVTPGRRGGDGEEERGTPVRRGGEERGGSVEGGIGGRGGGGVTPVGRKRSGGGKGVKLEGRRSGGGSVGFVVGSQVWAKWEEDGLYYMATINARFGNGNKYSVEFEFDGKSLLMSSTSLRPFSLETGHRCLVATGAGRTLFPAIVVEVVERGQTYLMRMEGKREDGGGVELMGPMPMNKRLFRGFGIVLTMRSRGDASGGGDEDDDDGPHHTYHSNIDKSYVRRQIEEGGGTVIRDWSEVVDFRERRMKSDAPATVLVVSSRPARTKKYLVGVGMGVRTVSCAWIRDCCTNNMLEDFENYPLSNGRSKEFHCWIGAVKFKPNGVFADKKLFVFSQTSGFKRDWEEIIQAAGGKVLSKKSLGVKSGVECDYVLCENVATGEERRFFEGRTKAEFVCTEPTPIISFKPVVLPSPEREVDLQLRVTAPAGGTDLPIILLSHGHGPSNHLSSLEGYAPLADFYAGHGFVVIQPTHLNSKSLNLPSTPEKTREYLLDSRAKDMTFILDHLDEIEAAVPFLQNRLDRTRIAVAGHSLGACTASILLGAINTDPRNGFITSLADARIKAGILIGGPGNGGDDMADEGRIHFPSYGPDFSTLNTPTLVVWGEEDVSPYLTVRGADWHADAYKYGPGADASFMVKGGKHGFGGISGWDAKECQDESPERLAAVQRVTWAYLRSKLFEGDDAWQRACEALVGLESIGRIESKE